MTCISKKKALHLLCSLQVNKFNINIDRGLWLVLVNKALHLLCSLQVNKFDIFNISQTQYIFIIPDYLWFDAWSDERHCMCVFSVVAAWSKPSGEQERIKRAPPQLNLTFSPSTPNEAARVKLCISILLPPYCCCWWYDLLVLLLLLLLLLFSWLFY